VTQKEFLKYKGSVEILGEMSSQHKLAGERKKLEEKPSNGDSMSPFVESKSRADSTRLLE